MSTVDAGSEMDSRIRYHDRVATRRSDLLRDRCVAIGWESCSDSSDQPESFRRWVALKVHGHPWLKKNCGLNFEVSTIREKDSLVLTHDDNQALERISGADLCEKDSCF
jgi:hypothetical protein